MTKEIEENTTTVILCPHCKTNQEGVVGQETKCVNEKCGETFTVTEEVPVIVYGKDKKK